MAAYKELKILIVDDNRADRLILRSMLVQLGCKDILEAEDGGVAIFKLQNSVITHKEFDVLFLDYSMPKMDGLKLLTDLRRKPAFQDTKIIMITGNSDKDAVEDCLKAGADDFIVKPTELPILTEKMEKLFK